MNIASINIQYFILGIIVTYIPFHLFEEAMGNFPLWMYDHKWIPDRITYSHWMANNIFFYFPLLLIGLFGIHFGGDELLFLGVGIIIWGFINCFDHIIYSIIDRKVSPGLFTGLIFGTIAVTGVYNLYLNSLFTLRLVVLSIIFGFIYAFLPIVFSMRFHKVFRNIFIS